MKIQTITKPVNRPIWFDNDSNSIKVIDQRVLPHEFVAAELVCVDDVIYAIKEMFVRGAPLLGATGAFGVYAAFLQDKGKAASNDYLKNECERLKTSRPTAVNLAWGVDYVFNEVVQHEGFEKRSEVCLEKASEIVELEAKNCKKIGENGLAIIQEISLKKQRKTVNILTHCNAGWLACIEYGTATAPIYNAFEKGIDVHVWVDETRPLNQGSRLTAWELLQRGVNHTIITDNASGHLMQHSMVDLVIVGTDRTSRTGDVANKIGTYLKALAAKDNNVPFYVALPSTTFDWEIRDGVNEISIEERDPDEIRFVQGKDKNGFLASVLVPPEKSKAANHAFDVTPASLVTGFITERGVCEASEKGILSLFPEKDREVRQ